jgi:hypothetical protein
VNRVIRRAPLGCAGIYHRSRACWETEGVVTASLPPEGASGYSLQKETDVGKQSEEVPSPMDFCHKCKRWVRAAVTCGLCGMLLTSEIQHYTPPHFDADYKADWTPNQQVIRVSPTTSSFESGPVRTS